MRLLLKILRIWPPYFGAGVKVTNVSRDMTSLEVQMVSRPWNRNYMGTHFGGSLYSMVDPFLALLLIHHLGPHYVVWDKAATIRFKKPGKGTVKATISISHDTVQSIQNDLSTQEKINPQFLIRVVDSKNEVVAEVEKVLHVHKK